MKGLTLKQNLLWNTAGCLLYQGCQWLTTILVVTLSSSYENSGVLAIAMATGNVFSAFATYNMRTYQISDVNNRYSSNNYVAFRIVTISIAFAVCVIYSCQIASSYAVGIALIVYLLFKADETFVNVLYGIDQKAERMDFIGISQGLRGMISLSSFALALYSFDSLLISFVSMYISCSFVTILYDLPHSRNLTSFLPSVTRRT